MAAYGTLKAEMTWTVWNTCNIRHTI